MQSRNATQMMRQRRMNVKKIIDNTINRGEFNRAYKRYLESTAKIHCSYCGYHRGENDERKWYGGWEYDDMETCCGKRKGRNTRYPNWKLVSKNRKQWMKKPVKYEVKTTRISNRIYIDITW